MKKHMLILPVFLVAVVALILGAAIPGVQAQDEEPECYFNIEFNFSDEDLGVRGFFDFEPWKELNLVDPADDTIAKAESDESMEQQGYAEWGYESGEPTLADVSAPDFLARFPIGTYVYEVELIDGEDIECEADFTHVIPCGPTIDASFITNSGSVTITWSTPTTVLNPAATGNGPPVCVALGSLGQTLTIVGYEVIIEGEDIEYTFILPDDVNELVLPLYLFEEEEEYEYEVIAIEDSGNQTISEDEFEVPEPE